MASHHTKDKGDLGVVMVIADLVRNGINICLPMSEHLPFDLIAVNERGQLARVQVKYRSMRPQGVIELHFRSAYSDGNGYHEKPVDMTQFDCYAIYRPQTNKVYYLRNDDIPQPRIGINLRIVPPASDQKKRLIWASDYEAFDRIFN